MSGKVISRIEREIDDFISLSTSCRAAISQKRHFYEPFFLSLNLVLGESFTNTGYVYLGCGDKIGGEERILDVGISFCLIIS